MTTAAAPARARGNFLPAGCGICRLACQKDVSIATAIETARRQGNLWKHDTPELDSGRVAV